MTVEALNAAPPYTIAGVGPYAIPHAYVAEDLIVNYGTGVTSVLVRGVDFTVAPELSETGGNITLSEAAATTHAGKVLTIERYTTVEQGWQGTAGPREKGLERQLDEIVRGIQDAASRGRRALVIPVGADFNPLVQVPRPGYTLAVGPEGKRFVEGPSSAQIAGAQDTALQNVAATAAAAEAATAAKLAAEIARAGAEAVFAEQLVEIFDGTGAATEFDLVHAPGSLGNTWVTVGLAPPVVLIPGVGYSIDADDPRRIVFAAAPASGTGNVVIRYGRIVAATPGEDGREVELQTTATHVQWRYAGDASWTNLVALAALKGGKGDKGDPGDPGNSFTIAGDVATTGDLPAGAAAGVAYRVGGEDGDVHVKLPTAGYLNLGPIGGADGREVELGVSATHIRWRHVGDESWADIVALADIAGADAYIPNAGAFATAGDARYLRRGEGLEDLNNKIAGRGALDVAQKQASVTDTTSGRGMINGAHGLGSALPPDIPVVYASADVVPVTCLCRVTDASNPDDASAAALKLPIRGGGHVQTIRFNTTYAEQDFISIATATRGRRFRREQAVGVWGAWRPEAAQLLLEHFGAIGNGIADDSNAIEAALKCGQPVHGLMGKTYRYTRYIEAFGYDIKFDGNGCTFLADGVLAQIVVGGVWSVIRDVTAIEYSSVEAFITIASGANNYLTGDVCKIVSEEDTPFHPIDTEETTGSRKGEFVIVQDRDGLDLRIAGPLFYAYDLEAGCRIGRLSKHLVQIENVTLTNPPGLTSFAGGWKTPLSIWNAVNPLLRNIRSGYTYNNALTINSCYGGLIDGLFVGAGADKAQEPWLTDGPGWIDGDGVEISSCAGMKLVNSQFNLCRHGVTTGNSYPVEEEGSLRTYGSCCGIKVVSCTAFRNTSAGFDTHEGSRNIEFIGCTSYFCKSYGFSFRGVNITATDCESFCDRDGLHVFQPSNNPLGTTSYCKWINGRIINPVGHAISLDDTSATFFIEGGFTALISDEAVGGQTYASSEASLYYLNQTNSVVISGGHRIWARNVDLSSLEQIFFVIDIEGRIVVDGLDIDTSNSGLNAPVFWFRTGSEIRARLLNIDISLGGDDVITNLYRNAAETIELGNITCSGATGMLCDVTSTAALVDAGAILLPIRWGADYIAPRAGTNPPLASTPLYRGQETLVSGQWYKATGASSSADWKQITA